MRTVAASCPPPQPVQTTLDDLGTPLAQVTFVVVDLETTGGDPGTDAITEIGAVRVRGGQVDAEFGTLVNPHRPIPAFIAALTGIRDAMVATAPPVEVVLPAFLEFAHDCVLVAHNARFDIGFLRRHAERQGLAWPSFAVLDTVTLARHVLARGETRNHKLATLARLFASPTVPDHRALQDARATVDVLHGLLERVGNLGVHSLEDLQAFTRRVPPVRRRKRHLAEGVPARPGVYFFVGPGQEVLYVGTSKNLQARVRSYFTRAQTRARLDEMLQLAESVTPIVCQTQLEAQVREVRLIAEHRPRYNRRSRNPEQAPWLKLTDEPFPRLSLVHRRRADAATYLGPFPSRSAAEDAMAALHRAHRLRQCGGRLPRRPRPGASACVLAELGRCAAPCVGGVDETGYGQVVEQVRAALTVDVGPVHAAALTRMRALAAAERFEEAARERDRMMAFLRAADRTQRRDALAGLVELVAARRDRDQGGWEFVLVRHGRLAGTSCSPRGADPMPYVRALQAGGEEVPAPEPGLLAALPEETALIEGWLAGPGVRLVEVEGRWCSPVAGAGRHLIR